MVANNQGIVHASYSNGGETLCKSQTAHTSTTIVNFRKSAHQCKRCAAKVAKMDEMKAKNAPVNPTTRPDMKWTPGMLRLWDRAKRFKDAGAL